jgi:hypothetical protein
LRKRRASRGARDVRVTMWTGGRAIPMEKSPLREGASTSVNVTVGRRSREYLTEREVERLIVAA